jgi:glucose/mannose-6-phosphate isomerase
MNLDNPASFPQYDPQGMLDQIDGLPDQLLEAWNLGQEGALPETGGLKQIVIAGMGGSAIGADLLAAYAAPHSRVPIIVHRDYDLPAWARGPETLVIASSHSGNTEETLSAFQAALDRGCRCMVVSTGGKLAQAAETNQATLWRFQHDGQPRAAVGFSFGLLLAALTRLDLLPDPGADIQEAILSMKKQVETLNAQSPTADNPAKRIAGQMVGRWVTVFGAGLLAPVARRWKGQISEIAKAWAQFEFLPEANHNTLAGILNPADLFARHMALFLRAPSDHPRNRLRSDLTRQALLLEGISTDRIDARGESRLAHLWTSLHFGDYTAYYLAMAYEVDPTPVVAIEYFKREMVAAEGYLGSEHH